ncbi:hypothetical protein D3C80_1907210 [compost metagenome]
MGKLKGHTLSNNRYMPVIGVSRKFNKQIAAITNRIGYTGMQLSSSRISKNNFELRMLPNRYRPPFRRHTILQILAMRERTILKTAAR